ncbi:hypothetical protein ACOTTU_01060 [Roseobacter sp. EG26]|uniref:hypothetical protein n=1 Tax=Roseobacter sp. EG26 TaxID=3412477 RepID=UPI003CE4D114
MMRTPMTTDQQKGMVMAILIDMNPEDVCGYLEHVGFDVLALSNPKELPDAWLGHYRLGQGTYDVERAAMDLLTWPPISRRVFELQQAKG